MADTLNHLGAIIGPEHLRDAVHIAVAPVQAATDLWPGDHVRVTEGVTASPAGAGNKEAVGIIDPYLTKPVKPGEWCWVFLYPQTITSLHHLWSHRAFPQTAPPPLVAETEKVTQAKAWIVTFADSINQDYDSLMEAANLWVDVEEYTYDNSESYKNIPYQDWEMFWAYYTTITGKAGGQEAPFTCTC